MKTKELTTFIRFGVTALVGIVCLIVGINLVKPREAVVWCEIIFGFVGFCVAGLTLVAIVRRAELRRNQKDTTP